MEDKKQNIESLIPVSPSGLAKVNNSISITNKILKESRDRLQIPKSFRGELISEFDLGFIVSIEYSENKFYITNLEGYFYQYDSKSNLLEEIMELEALINCVAFNFQRNLIAFAGSGIINIIDLGKKQIIKRLKGHNGDIRDILFSHNNKFLISGGYNDSQIRVWNIENGNCERILSCHEHAIMSLALTKDDRYLYSLGRIWGEHSCVFKWDLLNSIEIFRFECNKEEQIQDMALSNNDRYLILRISRLLKGNVIRIIDLEDLTTEDLNVNNIISFSRDSKDLFLAAGGMNGEIYIWNFEERRLLKTIVTHDIEIFFIKIFSESNILFSVGRSVVLKIWE